MIKFLFFDAWPYEIVRDFRKTLHSPRKHDDNPVLTPETSWERLRCHMMGTVIRDAEDGVFKMWYLAGGASPDTQGHIYSLCYAVSEDGFAWKRPELDIMPWEGNPSNRLMERAMGASVLLDEGDPDQSRRYKMMCHRGNWIKALHSADGIHWKMLKEPGVINTYSDTHIGFWRDPDSHLYCISFRVEASRRSWQSESADLVNWTRPILAVEPDVNDPPQTEINAMTAFAYGHFTIGQFQILKTEENDWRWEKYDGHLVVEMCHSRHSGGWHRTLLGQELIPLGETGEWDSGMIHPASMPVFLEDEIRFYYSGTPFGHGGDKERDPPGRSPTYLSGKECIGSASLRIDGFVSLDAAENPGELLTRVVVLREAGLRLNARAPEGEIRAEIQQETGDPVPGFSLADCIPFRGDALNHEVRWRGERNSSAVTGVPVRVRVVARRAELYAISMPNGDPPTAYWDFYEPVFTQPKAEWRQGSYERMKAFWPGAAPPV